MKKKFVIFLLALIMPFAFVSATDDLLTSMPNRTDDVIFEDVPNDEVTKETYNGTKFSADFNVSSTDNVDGINFVAGSSVSVSGQNEYGAYAGSNVNIKGNILRELFAAGSSVNIASETVVGRDSYIAGSNVNMSGTFNRNVYIGAGSLVLSDVTINGNLKLSVSDITVLDNVVINGTLEYNDNATVSGIDKATINETKTYHVDVDEESVSITSKIKSVIFSMISLIIIAFVINLLFPKIYKSLDKKLEANDLLNKTLVGFGILCLTPMAAIFCMVTGVGLGLGFIVLALYIILCCISSLTVMSVVGNNIWTKVFKKEENIYLSIVIGIVVFKLVYLVPIIGGLLSFVSILIGLGYSKELMFPKKK